jgi:hypothetical protein
MRRNKQIFRGCCILFGIKLGAMCAKGNIPGKDAWSIQTTLSRAVCFLDGFLERTVLLNIWISQDPSAVNEFVYSLAVRLKPSCCLYPGCIIFRDRLSADVGKTDQLDEESVDKILNDGYWLESNFRIRGDWLKAQKKRKRAVFYFGFVEKGADNTGDGSTTIYQTGRFI